MASNTPAAGTPGPLHGIKVLMAKQYVDNLSEEVKKGLREKAQERRQERNSN